MDDNNNCAFCNGEIIDAEYISKGQKTMSMALYLLFGSSKREKTSCFDGIQLQQGNRLAFDSSSGEYAILGIEIKYCPFCGKQLEAINDEQPDDN